ncbi:MAG: RNA polymerase sigma factor [Nannocystaceae bacterium]
MTSTPHDELPRGAGALMARYVDGDPAAFKQLEALLTPPLRRMLRRYVHDDTSLDDVIQMTLLKAHLARHRFVASPGDRDGSVRAWYYTIGRHTALDAARKTSRQRARHVDVDKAGGVEHVLSDTAPSPDAVLTEDERTHEVMTRVREAIAALPEGQREVVEMHKLKGMTMAQVADRLAIQEGTARVRAHRAYKALAKRLSTLVPALVVGAITSHLWSASTGGTP